ncbi:MAG: adenylate/guanylate cyclase domain-containing protein, partial [Fimbriimonadaceae bacterium]|nr:adenylate/guanylate cyclase domain-containing protein [Alphaproteobacteria bacterium]
MNVLSSLWQDVTDRTITTRSMPPRVMEAIKRHDIASEILVKLIQLTVVLIWGILYLLAPKTDAGTAFSPVPFALTGYFVLNIIGLIWAIRGGLPNWSVYISIIFDIGVLMVLIWSFHIQYQQPPSFYLKAPTLLYVFIFIALRALRFEARFVMATGATAAAGWLCLVGYVVYSNPENTMITKNYVSYLTTNSVLLGAEFDKIISILLVSAIIALALTRAHKLMVRATSEGLAAQDMSRFFDQSIAEQIRNSKQALAAGEGLRREAAILYVDIRGFTPMAADMDPGQVVALLTKYQEKIVPLVQEHGGVIDKFLGDGIMATFGASRESDSFAADALRTVDAILAEAASWEGHDDLDAISGPRINAATAAGPIVFGVLGNETRLEYTVIGAA